MRATILLGEDARAREELYGELSALAAGEPSTTAAVDAVRRAVVAALRSRDRDRLVHELDRELLGLERRRSARDRSGARRASSSKCRRSARGEDAEAQILEVSGRPRTLGIASIGAPSAARSPFRHLAQTRRETVTRPRAGGLYRREVDESRAVLERLERIEALDRMGAAPSELVEELRALLAEAERWSRREGGEAGASAVEAPPRRARLCAGSGRVLACPEHSKSLRARAPKAAAGLHSGRSRAHDMIASA